MPSALSGECECEPGAQASQEIEGDPPMKSQLPISDFPATHADCHRVAGKPIIKAEIQPTYSSSCPQHYISGIGTIGRIGVCIYCDAAIYRQERPGMTYPASIHGETYHAVDGGLVAI
jgi:hypothetical protein